MAQCTHLEQVAVGRPDTVAGCQDCLAIGGQWVHLRVCRSCGHVGCCDSSPNRHASRHARDNGHPIARDERAIADARGAAVITDAEDALEVGGHDDAADLLRAVRRAQRQRSACGLT